MEHKFTPVTSASFLLSGTAGMGSRHQLTFGLAGVILGLLAVVGLNSVTLVLVTLLCLGTAALFNGALRGAKMAKLAQG